MVGLVGLVFETPVVVPEGTPPEVGDPDIVLLGETALGERDVNEGLAGEDLNDSLEEVLSSVEGSLN